jgi:hypothetical protein
MGYRGKKREGLPTNVQDIRGKKILTTEGCFGGRYTIHLIEMG